MLKRTTILAAGIVAASMTAGTASGVPVEYGPAAMLGVVLTFGGGASDFGITAKLLTTNEPDTIAGAAGVTWYPMSDQPWGYDLGIGYTTDAVTGTVTWDFTRNAPQIGFGWLANDGTLTPP